MDLSGQLIAGTGAFEIKEISDSSVYPLLDKGTKYLECTSPGTLAFQSNQVYGEWEFNWRCSSTVNSYINFINDRIDGSYRDFIGYNIIITSAEAILLRRHEIGSSANLLVTANGYLEEDTLYRLKITRTLEGEFTVYIKGGAFGFDEWTLVEPSSGDNPSTDNTYTDSTYFGLSFALGDRISNITMRKAVRQ